MDVDRKRVAIKLTIEKAREDLAAANELADLSHGRAAINRAYYVAFHAATAVLLWHDIERSKHTGVQAALNQFLVKPELVDVEYGRIFRKIRE